MPLSATCAYSVLRRWRVWAPAAALGGMGYGFSPYMVSQALGHLDLLFVPLPPLIVATLVKMLMGPRHPLRCGSALAGLIVAQYSSPQEILAMTAIICAIGIISVTAYHYEKARDIIRLAWRPAALALAPAFGLVVAALAYPLWYEFAGPAHYVGSAWPNGNPFYADVLDFVAPTPHQLLRAGLRSVGTRLSAIAGVEDGAYVGFAVLAIVVGLVWWCRRSGASGLQRASQ